MKVKSRYFQTKIRESQEQVALEEIFKRIRKENEPKWKLRDAGRYEKQQKSKYVVTYK